MNIALLGYGRMGKMIEEIAQSRGHNIVLKISDENPKDLSAVNLQKADVAIDFSIPTVAYTHVSSAIAWGVPIVSGTTGWLDKLEEVKQSIDAHAGACIYASNFSLGVNIFFEVNKRLAQLMSGHDQYSLDIEEIHHTKKLDAPSGTAITIAEGIMDHMPTIEKWVNDQKNVADNEINIRSLRIDPAPGTHTVTYTSDIDTIEFKHTAHSRNGFALGAVVAAEWLVGKKGFFSMKDVLGI